MEEQIEERLSALSNDEIKELYYAGQAYRHSSTLKGATTTHRHFRDLVSNWKIEGLDDLNNQELFDLICEEVYKRPEVNKELYKKY